MRLSGALQVRMQREKHRLDLLEQRVNATSPEVLLKRGYSITLRNGKAVIDASLLKEGDEIVTRLAKGEIKSKVIK